MRFSQDTEGELEEYFTLVLKQYFPHYLKWLNFLYTWRNGEKLDEDSIPIIASVRKVQNRDRDIFGFDVIIEVDDERWSIC